MPLSEKTVGGLSLPPTVTLTVKEAIMVKVKLIVHECFTGKQNPEDVFIAVFLSNRGEGMKRIRKRQPVAHRP